MKYNINMKKICSFLLILIIINLNCDSKFYCDAKSENVTYAKCLSNCILYKSLEMKDDLNEIYFVLPESYFVIILDKIDNQIYKVQYDKFIGYVYSKYVTIATFTPIVKFLENITCDIKPSSGTQVWSNPSTGGNILTTIQANEKNINYISFVYGEIPTGGESNIWYYINYTPSTNVTNVYEGYIYSENVTNLSEIVFNAESNPEVISESISDEDTINISSTLRTVIVALISTVFFKEKITKTVISSILITLFGIYLLNSGVNNSLSIKGLLFVFTSAFSYAIYMVFVKNLKVIKQIKYDKLSFYVMLLGLSVFIFNLKFCTQLQPITDWKILVCAIALAIFPTIISLETINIAIRLVGSTTTAIIGALEPLTAIFFGVLLFGEIMTLKMVFGVILILFGVILIVLRDSFKKNIQQ